MPRTTGARVMFTDDDDLKLAKYIAKVKPEPKGRLSHNIYIRLEENAGEQWPWSRRHPWTSWRERYKKNQEKIDWMIKRYQIEQRKSEQVSREKEEEEEEEEEEVEESSSETEQSVENQPQVEHKSSKANINAKSDRNKPFSDAPAAVARPRKIAETQEGKVQKKTVSSKLASDTRPQKVAATREIEAQPVTSKPLPESRPQKVVENREKEVKIVASKSAPDPKPQRIAEKRGDEVGAKTVASKPVVDSRPSKAVAQQDEETSSETEQENDGTQDDSVKSLSENEMRDLFGSFVEDEDEEEAEEEERQPTTSNVPRPDETKDSNIEILQCQPAPSIYPNLQDAPAPELNTSEPRVPGAFDVQPHVPPREPIQPKSGAGTRPAEKSPLKPVRPRPKQRARKVDEDPFETSSDLSSVPPPLPPAVSATKKPPILNEGHFRTTFKRSRVTVADNGEEEEEGRPWPPKRSKKERDAAKQSAVPIRQPSQVNAVASSSKTKLAPSIPANDTSAAIPRTHSEPLLGHDVSSRSSVMERRTLADIPRPKPSVDAENAVPANPRNLFRTLAPILKTSIKINNEITSTARSRSESDNLPTKPSSDTDPFTAKHHVSEKASGKARADDSYAIENGKQPRHIDLHQETLSKRRRLTNNTLSRRSSVLSSRASLSSTSPNKVVAPRKSNSLRQSISELDLPDDETKDFILAAAQDIAGKLERIAQEYGFSTEFAQKTYRNTRSVETTKFVLDQLRREREEQEKVLYERLNLMYNPAGNEHDSEDEIPYGLVRPKSGGKASGRSSTRSSPRKSKSKRTSLNIRPFVIDDDGGGGIVSDYSPPNSSRAGQFARLVRQGRRDEAIEREKRRASGVFVPQTQHGGGSGRSLLPREVTATPTPNPRDVVSMDIDIDNQQKAMDDEDDNDDDMYVYTDDEQRHETHEGASEQEHEADDEFENTQDQAREDQDHDHDHDESPSFIDDAQTLQEPEEARERNKPLVQEAHDRHRALALEHRLLALNVNADNADTMRKFESRNNPDFLRLMSLQLVGDLVAKYDKDEHKRGL